MTYRDVVSGKDEETEEDVFMIEVLGSEYNKIIEALGELRNDD